MINKLESGIGIAVSGYIGTSWPYIAVNHSNPIQGMLRISGQELQAFDGHAWINIPSNTAAVSLDNITNDLLQWARKRRDEESKWYALASSNEAVRIALEQLEQAKTRLELTAILAREYETAS